MHAIGLLPTRAFLPEGIRCRYQDQGEHLQVDNQRLSKELATSKYNLNDINEFLTNELKARALSSAALEHRVKGLEQKLADQKEHYDARLALQQHCN